MKKIKPSNDKLTLLQNRIDYLEKITAKYEKTEAALKKTRRDINARNKVLEAINAVADNIYRSLDQNTLTKEAIAAMLKYGKTASATMFEYHEDENCLVMLDSSESFEQAYSRVLTQRLYLDQSAAGDAVREKKIILCKDIATDPRIIPSTRKALLQESRKSAMFIPLLFKDRVLGTINLVFQKKQSFKDYELETLLSIGKTIGLAMANVRYLEEIKAETKERKKTQEALHQSEEKYRLLIENSGDAIFIIQKGFITYANPRTINLFGYGKEELERKPFKSFIIAETRKKAKTGDDYKNEIFHVIKASGKELSLEIHIVEIIWEGKKAELYFGRDVTEQKKLEAQFYQAQRMEAIGTLAGGLAHDFNNLLMGIQGNTSLMLLQIPPGSPHCERLKNIEHYVSRGSEIASQLLGFARGGKYEVKPIDLNELISKSSSIFGRTKKEISLHYNLAEDLRPVEADQGQIEQVFLNLYVNAWQAMPSGGNLFLSTANIELDEKIAEIHGINPGYYVRASITDDGTGMDEATQRRLFDPFFTTKERNHGTGLGLASAYGIIKNHAGFISVYSKQGEGTTFNIYLPVSKKEMKSEDAPVEEVPDSRGETILFVDDEEIIANVGKDMLESLGYRVLIAGCGKDAIEIYNNLHKEINLVILDLVMPDMGGKATFELLKKIKPSVRVLLSSGYSISGHASNLLQLGCRGFIQKPYDINKLAAKVREILDQE